MSSDLPVERNPNDDSSAPALGPWAAHESIPKAAQQVNPALVTNREATAEESRVISIVLALVMSLALSVLQRLFYGSWMTFYSLLASTIVIASPILISSYRRTIPGESQVNFPDAEWNLGVPLGGGFGFLYGLFFGGIISNAFYGGFVGAAVVATIRLRGQVPSVKPTAAWMGATFIVLHLVGFLSPGGVPSGDQQTLESKHDAATKPTDAKTVSSDPGSGMTATLSHVLPGTEQTLASEQHAPSERKAPVEPGVQADADEKSVEQIAGAFVIDSTGKVLFSVDCDAAKPRLDPAGERSIRDFRNGMAAVRKGGKWGFINKNGQLAIPCIYDRVGDFAEGLAAAKKSTEGYGFIRPNGTAAIPFMFDGIRSEWTVGPPGGFSEGKAPVLKGRRYGFIDKSGKLVIPADYDNVTPFVQNRSAVVVALVSGEISSGVIDEDGSSIVESLDGYLNGFSSDGIAMANGRADRVQFVDLNGKVIVPWKFGNPFCGRGPNVVGFSCGRAAVGGGVDLLSLSPNAPVVEAERRMRKMAQTGFIDKAGNLVIDIQFNSVKRFSDDRAVVQPEKDGKWGVIDTEGRWIVEPTYDDAERFSDGLAAIRSGSKWGYVDTAGKQVIAPQFSVEKAGPFQEGIAVLMLVQSAASPAKQEVIATTLATQETPQREETKNEVISSQDLYSAMANEFAAKKRFGNKPIVVVGNVVEVSEETPPDAGVFAEAFGKKEWCVKIGSDRNQRGYESWIACYCENSKGMENVKPGRVVRIEGNVKRRNLFEVEMTNCRIIE
jgi:hypothetical protein